MILSDSLAKAIDKSNDASFNMGVIQSIDVVQDVISRLKEGDPKENIGYVNLLDAVIVLLVNLKK